VSVDTKTLPHADTKRMAVIQPSAFRAVVDQAGGALTWDQSPRMQQALKEAAGKIRIPLLGMVAKNDRTTESVKAVVHEVEARGATAKLIVYPASRADDRLGAQLKARVVHRSVRLIAFP
jgi:alpha-beta hydrolase superfamily lysophospholipase